VLPRRRRKAVPVVLPDSVPLAAIKEVGEHPQTDLPLIATVELQMPTAPIPLLSRRPRLPGMRRKTPTSALSSNKLALLCELDGTRTASPALSSVTSSDSTSDMHMECIESDASEEETNQAAQAHSKDEDELPSQNCRQSTYVADSQEDDECAEHVDDSLEDDEGEEEYYDSREFGVAGEDEDEDEDDASLFDSTASSSGTDAAHWGDDSEVDWADMLLQAGSALAEGSVRAAFSAFVDRRTFFAQQRAAAAKEDLLRRREDLSKKLDAKREDLKNTVTERAEHLQKTVADRREHAQAVIDRNLVRLRERRAARVSSERASERASERGEHSAADGEAEAEQRPSQWPRPLDRPLDLTKKLSAKAKEKSEKAVAELAERREAAKAVISRNLVRVRERRAALSNSIGDRRGRTCRADDSLHDKRRGSRGSISLSLPPPPLPLSSSRGVAPSVTSPRQRKGRRHSGERSQSPPLTTAPSLSSEREEVLTATELAQGQRLRLDWGRPPSDRPDAVMVGDGKLVRCWRFRGDGGLDEYESEFELPVRPETCVSMAFNAQTSASILLSLLLLDHAGIAASNPDAVIQLRDPACCMAAADLACRIAADDPAGCVAAHRSETTRIEFVPPQSSLCRLRWSREKIGTRRLSTLRFCAAGGRAHCNRCITRTATRKTSCGW